ncbi:hypothetical protein RDI58_020008 [Solanum bulbocastanum]|uniref:Uncharacterized protein n=1 Tax=Solanum bulbocastanum TaxID=147425 RepID=A0AAN8TC24_SOLBU
MIYRPLKLKLTTLKFFEHIYDDLIDSCRLLMKNLGSPVLRHSFLQANQVVDFLSKIGAKLRSSSKATIMLIPRDPVIPLIKAYHEGVPLTKLVPQTTCNKLACFGNLHVIASMENNVTV